MEWGFGDVLWNTEQTPPALVRTAQANERTLAANNRLKGHPLLQYMESSIEPKEENWFLRMRHYFCEQFRTYSTHTGLFRFCLCFIMGLSR